MIILLGVATCADWSKVAQLVNQAIQGGLFPGAYLGVARAESVLLSKAFGSTSYFSGLFQQPVTQEFKWDLGEMTAAIGTIPAFMHLYEINKTDFRKHVTDYIAAYSYHLKENSTLENLLLHNSGLSSSEAFPLNISEADLVKQVAQSTPDFRVQSKYQYSNLNYIILGQCINRTFAYNSTRQAILYSLSSMNLRTVGFAPSPAQPLVPSLYNRTTASYLLGKPLNPLASVFKQSAAPHAGLFGSGPDVLRFMRIMLSGGLIPGEKTRSLSQDTVRLFTTKVSSLPYNNTRGIGYETKPNGKYPPCGSKFSNNSFGFNNSLGSYAWADKDNNMVVVLLVSGTMPGGVGPGERLQQFRAALSDLVFSTVAG